MKSHLFFILLSVALVSQSQDSTDYFYEIPDYPESYSSATVAARLVDGLGFRYYWGTEGLTDSDLAYRPSPGARNTKETLNHLYALCAIIKSTVLGQPMQGADFRGMSYQEVRNGTLSSLEAASLRLRELSDAELEQLKIDFGDGNPLPFWNLINGPMADAINHVGQVISFRRTNGNPYNQNVSVLRGTVKR